MATRIVAFLALVFTALALAPYDVHLFSLPNKIGVDPGGVLRVRLPGQCRDAEPDRCTGQLGIPAHAIH